MSKCREGGKEAFAMTQSGGGPRLRPREPEEWVCYVSVWESEGLI